jgi:HPt (histidine-containing phosphotransfer) domain-containing protein
MQSEHGSIGFTKPGGERCEPSKSRPVDLVHLSRQTMGDRQLEQEVLSLFLRQLDNIDNRLAEADEAERRRIAHALVGSARGVGAFAIGDCAAEIEKGGYTPRIAGRLQRLVSEANDFIASICR